MVAGLSWSGQGRCRIDSVSISRRSFIALDFETTGLSHRQGDRVIEVAVG